MAPDPNTDEIVARYTSTTIDDLVAKYAHDVSEGGMLLRSSSTLPIGKLVNFEVRLSDENVVLVGTGRIAWKREAPDGDRPAGVGVKFVDLDDASQALVDRLLAAKGDALGEFDRAPSPAAAETAKTVMGLGSPFLAEPVHEPVGSVSLPTADETRGRTKLGVSPVVLTPEERERVGTRLGLAAPVASAGLLLGDQSSPSVEALPPVREEATSDIDAAWGDEAKTGKREAPPVATSPPAPAARISQIPTVEVQLTDLPRLIDLAAHVAAVPAPAVEERPPSVVERVEEPPPKPSRARPVRPPASAIVDPPAIVPRRRPWLWIVLLLIVAAFGVYQYLGVPSESSSSDAPSPSAVAAPEPAPPTFATTTVATSEPPPPASAPPLATTSPSAISFGPIAQPDAGKHQPPPKASASAKPAHAPPSASAPAKPRPPPKPTPSDDNPY
jgi:uncharacterized protein (TIGR02266 family)